MDVPAQVDVEAKILKLSGLMDYQVTEVAKRASASAEAEVEFKLARAKALLVSERKTAADREAEALIKVEDEYRAYMYAAAVLTAAQEAGRTLRSQMDGIRSINANLRSAITYAEGVGG